ncbi:hypothetical protein ACXR2U_05680 [Jatrophihabitans sp. YIM 134969]
MPDDVLVVRTGDAVVEARPDTPVTFGRSLDTTVCLGAEDRAVSRRAGVVEHESGQWWVRNTSASRSFAVADGFGLRTVVPPGRRVVVESALRVIVDGTSGSYELAVDPPTGRPAVVAVDPPAGDDATVMGGEVVVNRLDRAAMVALFAGYLEQGERYEPHPKSYAAAAARLGWPRTTLVKRIEYLRTRLTAAGVPGLTGWNALDGLAEWALTNRIVTPDDLRLLPR